MKKWSPVIGIAIVAAAVYASLQNPLHSHTASSGTASGAPAAGQASKQSGKAQASAVSGGNVAGGVSKPETGAKPAGTTLDSLMNNWLRNPGVIHSQVGIEVMELPSGRVLYSRLGNRRFTPASTAKVLTTSCAYATLGPNFVYKTQMMATGPVTGDTVDGDLIIVPSEDPSFKRDDLRQMFESLRQQKIKRIEGILRLADVKGGYDAFDPSWLVEDFGQEWMPVCSNFVIDRNIAQGVANIRGYRNVIFGPADANNAMERSLLASDVAAGWVTLDGRTHEQHAFIGNGVTPKSPLSVTNPDEYNLALAWDMLQEFGIKTGKPHSTPIAGAAIVEHLSKPLPILLTHTLHQSDNLYAQQLLRTLGLPATGARLEDSGLGKLNHWLASIGVPQQEVVIFDGCGLSRKNSISPHALNTVLKFMAGPNVNGPYLGFMKANGQGKALYHFKTGGMDTVSCVTGVLDTVGGQHLACTIMVNAHTPSIHHVRGAIFGLVELLDQIKSINVVARTAGSTEPPPETDSYATVELANPGPKHAGSTSHGTRRRRRH